MLEKKFQQMAELNKIELELKTFELELKKRKLWKTNKRKRRPKMELEEHKIMMEFIKKYID